MGGEQSRLRSDAVFHTAHPSGARVAGHEEFLKMRQSRDCHRPRHRSRPRPRPRKKLGLRLGLLICFDDEDDYEARRLEFMPEGGAHGVLALPILAKVVLQEVAEDADNP